MKHIKTLVAFLLLACMAFCLFACDNGDSSSASSAAESSSKAVSETSSEAASEASSEAESKEESKTASFTVKVVDTDGNAVAGAMVQVCKDSCIPAKADENGVATFPIEITDGYKLSVLSCPAGYEYKGEAEIYLDSGITEYTLELTKAGN